jgi:hypothetical protein
VVVSAPDATLIGRRPGHHGRDATAFVSATAEQFGGAVGISVTCVSQLHANVDASPLKDLTSAQYGQLRDDIVAAEQTGLRPKSFDPRFAGYLHSALDASNWGYTAAFLATSLLAIAGLFVVWRLIRNSGVIQPLTAQSGEPRVDTRARLTTTDDPASPQTRT